jgi:uncharacterized sulfatase
MRIRLVSSLSRVLLLLLALCAHRAGAADRPNILWLTSEDHGPEMGCYGDPLARTPNVDALAAKGMRFNRAWSNHPVCAPARTAIISGLHATSSGGVHMRSMVPMPKGAKMYPEYLREAGYYATNNSKEDYNLEKTDATWDDSSGRAHWRNRKPGQPFFAIFNSTKSHESQIRTRPHQAIVDPAKVRVPAYHPDTPEVRQDWAQYYDKVSEADADAGVQLKEIEAAGLAADTIVFYYGDHGSGMPRSKRWPSNSGLHVPLVVYFPPKWQHLAPKEYRPGGASDRMVSFVDLAPTVLSIAGVRPPEWMQGHAFAGPHQVAGPAYLFGARGRMDERPDTVRSVTDGRYVYVRNYFPQVGQGLGNEYQMQTPTTRIWREWFDQRKTNAAQSNFWTIPKAPEELYDLTTDRDEVNNLAAKPEHRATLDRLRTALREHLARVRDVCFLPEGELHARAQGGSPYDLARDDAKYPFARIHAAADLASNLDPAALPQLVALTKDTDSAVRYWATLGFLMRGEAAVRTHEGVLRAALQDASPHVRVVAAQALVQYGPAPAAAPALEVLRELTPVEKNGFFVSLAAYNAIETLGPKAGALRAYAIQVSPNGVMPHNRYDSYIPRLIQNLGGGAPASAAKKGKKKKG